MYKYIYIGVDPGVSGGIAVLTDIESRLYPMPVIKKAKGGQDYDTQVIVDIFQEVARARSASGGPIIPLYAAIERVTIFPIGKNRKDKKPHEVTGMVPNTKQFYCAGLFHGIFAALRIPFQEAHSQSWKRRILGGLGDKGDKAAAIKYANNAFPEFKLTSQTKKFQNSVADAICLACYAREVRDW